MSNTGNRAFSSANGALAGALDSTDSTTNNAGGAVQRASNALRDRLDNIELALEAGYVVNILEGWLSSAIITSQKVKSITIGELALDVSNTGNRAFSSANGALAGALDSTDSTTNNASASVQRARHALGGRLDVCELSLQVAISNTGNDTLCSTLDTTNYPVSTRQAWDGGGRDHAGQSERDGESGELHYRVKLKSNRVKE
jgi:flavin-binding protein dodecin